MKTFKNLAIASVAVFCGWVATDSFVNAQAVATQPASTTIARQLLVNYWEKGKSNRTESEQLYDNSAKDFPILQAYTLNRMQHNRYTQARWVASELTRLYPDDVEGRVQQVWLDAVTDNCDRALINMMSLKLAMGRAKAVLDADAEKMVLQRLGRLIGYMQGPVNSAINPDTLQQTIDKVTRGFTVDQLKVFNEAREKVLTTYESRLQKRSNKEKEETDKAIVQAQTETRQIKDQNIQIDLDRGRIVSQIDLLRQDAAKQVSILESQLPPLQATGSSIASQLDSVRADLQILRYDIILVQNALFNHPRHYYLRQRLAYLVNQANIREFDFARLINDLNSVDAQIGNITAQIIQTQNQHQGQIDVMSNEIQLGQRTKRRNLKKLAQLAKGPRVISAKLNSIDIRTDALTTYDPFPIELYRDRLLKRLN